MRFSATVKGAINHYYTKTAKDTVRSEHIIFWAQSLTIREGTFVFVPREIVSSLRIFTGEASSTTDLKFDCS